MERDVSRYESSIKERAWSEQKEQLEQMIDIIKP